MNIKQPLHNYVIIKQLESSETMYGSILLPDMGKEAQGIGEIKAIGEGAWDNTGTFRIPMSVKVGDIVVYPSYGPLKINVGYDEFIACRDSELVTILEK
jgi:chaperonin GroES